MPVRPVRFDAKAPGLSVESIHLAITELDMLDRFVSIVHFDSLGTRTMIAEIIAVCWCLRSITLK